jgi:hypothetical protein
MRQTFAQPSQKLYGHSLDQSPPILRCTHQQTASVFASPNIVCHHPGMSDTCTLGLSLVVPYNLVETNTRQAS